MALHAGLIAANVLPVARLPVLLLIPSTSQGPVASPFVLSLQILAERH